MKCRLYGYVVAGGIVLGMASSASAQVTITERNPYNGEAFTAVGPRAAYTNGYGINGYGNPYYPPPTAYAGAVVGYSNGGGYAPLISPGSSWFNNTYAPAGPILSANWPYIAPGPSWYTNYSYGTDFGHWKYSYGFYP